MYQENTTLFEYVAYKTLDIGFDIIVNIVNISNISNNLTSRDKKKGKKMFCSDPMKIGCIPQHQNKICDMV
jgi:hypothetical protein